MAEYIERTELLRRLRMCKYLKVPDTTIENRVGVLELIQKQEAADVAPVVHGRWEKHKTMHGFVYCSSCKDVYLDAEWLADGKWGYCPNCGAKMDKEENDEAD